MSKKRDGINSFNGLVMRVEGEGPLLLFLHDLGGSSLDWQAQLEYFSSYYRVVALDLPGHGQSKALGALAMPALVQNISAWLCLQPSPAWIIGSGFGAMVALELALAEPRFVKALVLCHGASEYLLQDSKEQARHQRQLNSLAWFGMRFFAWQQANALMPGAALSAQRRILSKGLRRNDKAVYQTYLTGLVGWSVRASLSLISQPVALILTRHDEIPLAHRVAQLAALPNASLHTPHGYGAWPLEDPSGFNRLLACILREQD